MIRQVSGLYKCIRWFFCLTYGYNHNGTNNSGRNNECSAGKKGHERDLPFHVDLDLPKEWKRDREEVDIGQNVQNHNDKNIDARVGGLTDIYADMISKYEPGRVRWQWYSLPGSGLICQNLWKGWHDRRRDNSVAIHVTARMIYANRTRVGRCWRPVVNRE